MKAAGHANAAPITSTPSTNTKSKNNRRRRKTKSTTPNPNTNTTTNTTSNPNLTTSNPNTNTNTSNTNTNTNTNTSNPNLTPNTNLNTNRNNKTYCTLLCSSILKQTCLDPQDPANKGLCTRPNCSFAHTINELRIIHCNKNPTTHDISICRFYHQTHESKCDYYNKLKNLFLQHMLVGNKKRDVCHTIYSTPATMDEDFKIAKACNLKQFKFIIDNTLPHLQYTPPHDINTQDDLDDDDDDRINIIL